MIVLDENIPEAQRLQLRAWRIPAKQIGVDWGHKGLQDHQIVVALRELRGPVFVSRDLGFYGRELCHPSYCLAVMGVSRDEVAFFVRRFLRHPLFDTQAKRLGRVVRITSTGIAYWWAAKPEARVRWTGILRGPSRA